MPNDYYNWLPEQSQLAAVYANNPQQMMAPGRQLQTRGAYPAAVSTRDDALVQALASRFGGGQGGQMPPPRIYAPVSVGPALPAALPREWSMPDVNIFGGGIAGPPRSSYPGFQTGAPPSSTEELFQSMVSPTETTGMVSGTRDPGQNAVLPRIALGMAATLPGGIPANTPQTTVPTAPPPPPPPPPPTLPPPKIPGKGTGTSTASGGTQTSQTSGPTVQSGTRRGR